VFAIPDLAGTSTAPGTGTVPRHNTEKVRLTSSSHVPPGFSPLGVRPLIGRDSALEVLDDLLSSARAASSVVLVVRGGPGLGKTALLEHAIRSAADLQVARAAGVEAELDLPYAALHQLLTPFVAGIGELPDSQRDAIATTLGLTRREPADPFLVALATLTLLSNASAGEGLLCAVDDAEWLDAASAQVLSFVSRRLGSGGLAMLFSAGTTRPAPVALEGLPELRLSELGDEDSRELLRREVAGTLDRAVTDRLLGEAEGNPLALIELAHSLTAEQLSGMAPLPEHLPLGEQLERTLMRNVRALPADVQSMLVLVASEQSGDPEVLGRAADSLGLRGATLAQAESVLRIGPQITFRHELVRSAVYAGAPDPLRRQAHLALAAAMDPVADQDRAAWHRAAAAVKADERVAADLATAATRARERGGHAAEAAVLERAARLSPEATARISRTLHAAEARLASGDVGKASILLGQASPELLNERQRAEAQRLRAALALARGDDGGASLLLLDAARGLERFDLRGARDTYLDALAAAMFAGRLAVDGGLAAIATAAHGAPSIPSAHATAADFLLDGFATLFSQGSAGAAPSLRRGVRLALDGAGLRAVGLAFFAALELWDESAAHALAARRVDLARETGALLDLPSGLSQLGLAEIVVGRFGSAEACFEEAGEISAATGNPGVIGHTEAGKLLTAAWRGTEDRSRTLAQSCAADGNARGFGSFVGFAHYSLTVLELGLGHYREAMLAAQDASLDPSLVTRTAPELAEAASRAGEHELAAEAVHHLSRSAAASGTPWALGTLARSRALLSDGTEAEDLYVEAIERLRHCRAAPQLARARLVYGEWLRRERRRRDAREELGAAFELFQAIGADAFADRARTELGATGRRLRRRATATAEPLTPHERRIATLVGEGASNAEIAAQLFISPRTVEYHLAKVFRKRGISSRAEVARALDEDRAEGGR
jgi:DNA-binding CsgD family transcriptional regulator